MAERQTIAAFDFDDTLIRTNTLPDFIRFSVGPAELMFKSLRFTPNLLLFAMKRINNQIAKERLLVSFFGGMKLEAFKSNCERYCRRLDSLANPVAVDRVKWHQSQGHEVVIISASAEDWIDPWAETLGVDQVIATRLEKKDGRLTGKINGKNCHSAEKVQRLLEAYPDRETYKLISYGDGRSDQQLFKFSDEHFEKTFA